MGSIVEKKGGLRGGGRDYWPAGLPKRNPMAFDGAVKMGVIRWSNLIEKLLVQGGQNLHSRSLY